MTPTLRLLTTGAAVGSALVGGVFFAFSSFVMPALARLPAAQGIAAMQSINVTVINKSFMTAFVGTAVVCSVIAASSAIHWHDPNAKLRFVAALLYVMGAFALTRIGNIPLNDTLAAMDPNAPGAAKQWSDFLSSWTSWNHLRTVAALGAAGMFIWSAVRS